MTSDLTQWESAFIADAEGRSGQLSLLIRNEPLPLEFRERLALRLMQTTPPKRRPLSKRIARVADAAETLLIEISKGALPNDALRTVTARYPDVSESVLDNAVFKKARTDVLDELERRGVYRTKKRRKLNLETVA